MYTHLNLKQRVCIAKLLRQNKSYRYIAKEVGCHVSTIQREYERNKDSDGVYRARKAHKKAKKRHQGKNKISTKRLRTITHSTHMSPQHSRITGQQNRSVAFLKQEVTYPMYHTLPYMLLWKEKDLILKNTKDTENIGENSRIQRQNTPKNA